MKALFELSAVLMPGASLTLFADLGACRVQKSSVTICVLPAPSGWRATAGLEIPVRLANISIHALRVEGDLATPIETPLPPAISIHALRVEGDHLFSDCSLSIRISIHALRVEGDIDDNPTLDAAFVISIHALRVEGDSCGSIVSIPAPKDFYPRRPGGGRLLNL